MIKGFLAWFKKSDKSSKIFLERVGRAETSKDLLIGLSIAGAMWALAWYGHIIGPWIDHVMGWGPHVLDSAGKIRWRRIWSTAICLPGIIALIGMFLRTRWIQYKMNRPE